MNNQASEITTALKTFSNNVKFKYIENFNTTDLNIVYDLNIATSNNTINKNNYSNVLNLTVKLLNNSALTLMQKGEEITDYLLTHNFTTIQEVIFNNSVEIFWDNELKMNQYTLVFTLYKSNLTT